MEFEENEIALGFCNLIKFRRVFIMVSKQSEHITRGMKLGRYVARTKVRWW